MFYRTINIMSLDVVQTGRDLFIDHVDKIMNSDLKVLSDYTHIAMSYTLGGTPYSDDAKYVASSKAINFDLDETLTRDGIVGFNVYLKNLAHINPYIEVNELKEIGKIVRRFAPGNIEQPKKQLIELYRKYRVTGEHHRTACDWAVDSVKMIPNCSRAVRELRKRGYVVGITTGSPIELAKEVYKNKLGFGSAWEEHNLDVLVRGTEFIFEDGPDGLLKDVKVMLHENKREASKRFAEEVTGFPNGLMIAVGDQPGDAYMISSFINPFMMVGREMPIREVADIILWVPEVRKDMMLLIDHVKRYEYAIYSYLAFSDEEKGAMGAEATRSKEFFGRIRRRKYKSLDELESLKADLIGSLDAYFKDSRDLMPLKTASISDMLLLLEDEEEGSRIREKSNNLHNKLKKHSHHFIDTY